MYVPDLVDHFETVAGGSLVGSGRGWVGTVRPGQVFTSQKFEFLSSQREKGFSSPVFRELPLSSAKLKNH